MSSDATGIYSADTVLFRILHDPLFSTAGRFLFPYSSCIDASWNIGDIPRLLPFHSNIRTETSIDVLSYLHREAAERQIFYRIYQEDEIACNPGKADSGLFYFKGRKDAPFAIIAAGGSSYVGSIHESFPQALALSRLGYNAFALNYRISSDSAGAEDLARAVSFVFSHSRELEVDTSGYAAGGSGGGARIAADVAMYGIDAFGEPGAEKPSAIIMQYPDCPGCLPSSPPVFVCSGVLDDKVPWRELKHHIDCLKEYGIPAEMHLYDDVGHGFGLGLDTPAEGWINSAITFWMENR